jgi:hypothetical protein
VIVVQLHGRALGCAVGVGEIPLVKPDGPAKQELPNGDRFGKPEGGAVIVLVGNDEAARPECGPSRPAKLESSDGTGGGGIDEHLWNALRLLAVAWDSGD